MDSRLLLRTLTSGEHNTADLPAKNIRNESTPRKVPFKDATNQSSAFKTPLGRNKNEIGKSKEIPTTVNECEMFLDFQPSTQGCYCYGDNKSDAEAMMERMITPEFMKILAMDPLLPLEQSDNEDELISPMPKPMKFTFEDLRMPEKVFDTELPDIDFDEDFKNSLKISNDSGFSHGCPVLDETDEMVIPEFDFNFSSNDLESSSVNCDDSFIKQW